MKQFLKSDMAGGFLLMLSAVLAMFAANSGIAPLYTAALDHVVTLGYASAAGQPVFAIQKPVILWINDFLMAIFFLYVGLEIKREFAVGALSHRDRAILPFAAAVGGMLMPALIYLGINHDQPQFQHGWAVPSATDIAFALGLLAVVKSRVPLSIKVLLTAIAILDDLGAIVIIALFYADHIVVNALLVVALAWAALWGLNRAKVTAFTPYMLIGLVLWVAMLKSGVHATLAGVLVALTIPLTCPRTRDVFGYSPLNHLEHALKPWVVFLILPIFGFANAGISLSGMDVSDVLHPVTLGIAAGLFFGKQLGILLFSYVSIKAGITTMPQDATWRHVYGMALLCGIGFTMALFIGDLAFSGTAMDAYVRMGVMGGSLASALLGLLVLRLGPKCENRLP